MTVQARIGLDRSTFSLDVELACGPGEVVALLGPNGSGKTTVLRCIAGLLALDAGRIELGGRVVDDPAHDVFVRTEDRRVGMVFQHNALFPHLTIRQNIEFGPRSRRAGDPQARADHWVQRLNLGDVAERRPGEVSGGQAQRCALGRALASDPNALLLDEPLAALDVGTRAQVRSELRTHLRAFERGCLLVTHDPLDALILADRIVVIERGRVVQRGSVAEVAARPMTEYVAALMGVSLIRGRASDGVIECDGGGTLVSANADAHGSVVALVRPQAVSLHANRPEGSPRNVWSATVTDVVTHVDVVRVTLAGPPTVVAAVTTSAFTELGLQIGAPVWLSIKATDIEVYPDGC